MKTKIRPLRADEVTFTVEPQEEHVAPKDMLASGDDELDKKDCEEILRRLRQGDVWAWCSVKVTAHWHGFDGSDHLGCCSYEDKKDFCQPGGYFDDMKERALDELNAQLAGLGEDISELIEAEGSL